MAADSKEHPVEHGGTVQNTYTNITTFWTGYGHDTDKPFIKLWHIHRDTTVDQKFNICKIFVKVSIWTPAELMKWTWGVDKEDSVVLLDRKVIIMFVYVKVS